MQAVKNKSIAQYVSEGFVRVGVLGDCDRHTQDAMRAAFDKVHGENWKDEIVAEVPFNELHVTIAAIVHFAGSESYVKFVAAKDAFELFAPGYYARIGA